MKHRFFLHPEGQPIDPALVEYIQELQDKLAKVREWAAHMDGVEDLWVILDGTDEA